MMKRLLLAALMALLIAAPVSAAEPVTVYEPGPYTIGDTIHVSTTTGYPVRVVCFKGNPKSSLPVYYVDGQTVPYDEGLGYRFTLGGQTAYPITPFRSYPHVNWVMTWWMSGDATCYAQAVKYVYKSDDVTIRRIDVIASYSFAVSG